MSYKFNPFTAQLDKVIDPEGDYVKIIGDLMSGKLTISPSGNTSLDAQKNIVLKTGRKLFFDGD